MIKRKKLCSDWYLKNYPDVAASGMSAEEHYQLFGSAEGRRPCPPTALDKIIARSRIFFKVIQLLAKQQGSYWRGMKEIIYRYKQDGFEGLKHFVVRTFKQHERTQNTISYTQWLMINDRINFQELQARYVRLDHESCIPLISIVMATYNTPVNLLKAAIDSVINQPYKKWELCIADDKSTNAATLACLKKYELADSRIKVIYRNVNGHISEATNSALSLAVGDFVAFMDHDDELHPAALLSVAEVIVNDKDAQLIYSDEDKIDLNGNRSSPYFKSDFNYELLLTQNMICHLAVFKMTLIKDLNGLRGLYNGAQDHDFVLRATELIQPEQIIHIPKVLYHWRVHSASTAASTASKPYAIEAGRNAVRDHIERVGLKAEVIAHPMVPFWHRVKFLPNHNASIEIIIPTRDRIDLMRMCINSILRLTSYKNYRITIVDNGSVENDTLAQFDLWKQNHPSIRIIRDDSPFNYSRINNLAVKTSKAELICLLNNDIEIISADWLEEMASHALRDNVGCVGARLWYPNNTLQHGGIILGIGGVAGHSHKYFHKEDAGYFGRAVSLQTLSAVTAACLMIKRSIYEQVRGLDENIKVAFNDVDFCLRVREAGYRNVWTPFAEMYHHESATRGHEDDPEKVARFNAEVEFMKKRWNARLITDPFYSPNLTLVHEDFSLAEIARVQN